MMRTCEDRVPAIRELADSQPCLAVGLSSGSVRGLSKMDRQKAPNSLFGELNKSRGSLVHVTGGCLRYQARVQPLPVGRCTNLGMGLLPRAGVGSWR